MNANPLEVLLKENGKNKIISITFNFEEFKDQLLSLKEKFSKLAEGLEKAVQELKDPGRISLDIAAGEVEEC